jgi:hypothetical protein
MRKLIFSVAAAILLAIPSTAFAAGNGAGGVTGPAFYVDGELYRTVGTPTDFASTGAPDHSFDIIYAIDGQPNVATAAPGDPGFNGGRWKVIALSFSDYELVLEAADADDSGDLNSADEVHAAMATEYFEGSTFVRSFECPVIPVP